MPLDIEKYRHYLNGCDLSEAEKIELIKSVWTILESFVDHAFGCHPIQHCGRALEHSDLHKAVDSLESAQRQPGEKHKPIRYEDLKRLGPR